VNIINITNSEQSVIVQSASAAFRQ